MSGSHTRARFRRAAGLRGAVGVTLLGSLLPGIGYVWSGRRLGYGLLVGAVGMLILLVSLTQGAGSLLDLAFDPGRLRIVAAVIGTALLLWVFVVVTTYLMVRPTRMGPWRTGAGAAFVCALCLAVTLPVGLAMRAALAQAGLVSEVFAPKVSATVPKDVTKADPWGGRDRVSVLIIGGDAGPGRTGVRTDTMILLSMDTRTGKAVMFSLPRNMMYAEFPTSSPLHDVFPDGFNGAGDPASWMLNAVYGQVPALYPHILGKSDNEGADALKQAVQGSLGTPVDYYALVELKGFRKVVDAMGGVTVNINERVAIGGSIDHNDPPDDYLEPGPDQHLDGFHALWFARGRWGSDDYQRMLRQRCMINALVSEADPIHLLTHYTKLAEAGREIVETDIPRELMPAFVDLGTKVKEHRLKSLAFVSSDKFFSGDPDYEWMHETVDKALAHKRKKAGSADDPSRPVAADDVCGYHPVS